MVTRHTARHGVACAEASVARLVELWDDFDVTIPCNSCIVRVVLEIGALSASLRGPGFASEMILPCL
jgi:hypothetical protein